MSEETNHGLKPVVIEEEYKNGEGCATKSDEQGNPVSECAPKLD